MTRLPNPGGDDNQWGDILNAYLEIAHNGDGSLKPNAVINAGAVTQVNSKAPVSGAVNLSASDVGALTQSTADGRYVAGTESSSAPGTPATNDLWYDSTNDIWKRWNGSAWVSAGVSQASLTSQLSGYAPLAAPALTGAATLDGSPVLSQEDTIAVNALRTGSGAPTALNTDQNGDVYINSSSLLLYTFSGSGTSGSWGSGTSLANGSVIPISARTVSYTVTLADAGVEQAMNVASANTLTIPTNASVAFPTGTVIPFRQVGAGQITITPASGVTLHGSSATRTQGSAGTVTYYGSDTWYIDGDMA